MLIAACSGNGKPFSKLASVQEDMFNEAKNTQWPPERPSEEKYEEALQALVGTQVDVEATPETGITFEEKLKVNSVDDYTFEKTIYLWAKANNAHICDTWDMVAIGYDGNTPACAFNAALKFEPNGEPDIMQVAINPDPHAFDFLKRVDKIVITTNKETYWQLNKEQDAHEKEIIFK